MFPIQNSYSLASNTEYSFGQASIESSVSRDPKRISIYRQTVALIQLTVRIVFPRFSAGRSKPKKLCNRSFFSEGGKLLLIFVNGKTI
jgi:hypothetical protein